MTSHLCLDNNLPTQAASSEGVKGGKSSEKKTSKPEGQGDVADGHATRWDRTTGLPVSLKTYRKTNAESTLLYRFPGGTTWRLQNPTSPPCSLTSCLGGGADRRKFNGGVGGFNKIILVGAFDRQQFFQNISTYHGLSKANRFLNQSSQYTSPLVEGLNWTNRGFRVANLRGNWDYRQSSTAIELRMLESEYWMFARTNELKPSAKHDMRCWQPLPDSGHVRRRLPRIYDRTGFVLEGALEVSKLSSTMLDFLKAILLAPIKAWGRIESWN
ncbi:hypothetical protein V8F20_004358 [Naviculisporaceae sp. PSN 640]